MLRFFSIRREGRPTFCPIPLYYEYFTHFKYIFRVIAYKIWYFPVKKDKISTYFFHKLLLFCLYLEKMVKTFPLSLWEFYILQISISL